MTDIENREDTPCLEYEGDDGDIAGAPRFDSDSAEETECDGEFTQDNGREEYERLIKERFREHYAADMQRLINRRFKKYKALEERVRSLEAEASRYTDLDILLREERERAVRETEERMNNEFRAMRGRPSENGISPRLAKAPFDVSRLTKSERALLATRAQKGEKIHL